VVIVRTFASQKVYVGGEVGKPGPVQMTMRENLLQVMNDAGWITPLATRDQLYVVRRGADGKDAIYPINFRKILTGEDMSQNVMLQPGDLLLVPPSGVVEVDRWVDQYIRQMIPISSGAFVNAGGR
jgi:polysaccharide biosynthesis/export protein PslD